MGDGDLLASMATGALAGAAATWVMGQVTSYLYEREDKQARQMEDDARGGKTAYGVAAEKAAGVVGRELSEDERKRIGSAIHWALGAGAGAVYGAARGRLAGADAAGGLVFGLAFWLLIDEGANVALGLTPGPAEFPWQAHARGLAGHLVFGVATEAALALADRVV
jgi:hypothetical protein